MVRAGVLLPRSSLFPAIGIDLITGIKSCLQYQGIQDDFVFITDNIGFGIEEAEIYTKAERMLLQENADLVIVVADLNIKELLEPLFTSFNKILLMVNMGTGIPDQWSAAPTTIIHSLNFSFQNRLTGQLAAKESGSKQGAFALSFYDSGYRQVYAIMNSFQQNGGQIMYSHITHIKKEQQTLAPLSAFFAENTGVQSLLCLFTADMADWFCENVIPLQRQFGLQLYATPMLLEAYQARLTAGHTNGPAIKGYTCWTQEQENPANTIYKESFSKAANKAANLFGLLGWDAGLLLKEIHQLINTGETNAAAILPALANKKYDSPRGWMKLDPSTFHTYGPCQLISWSENGSTKKVEECKEVVQEWSAFTAEKFPPDTSSGWRNTFLCI